MNNRNLALIFSLLLAVGLIFSLSTVSAENEPNDHFINSEMVHEGTFTGSVNETDSDLYHLTIPPRKDLVFTLKKTDYGNGEIRATSYDSDRDPMLNSGIGISTTYQGVEMEDSYWNSGDLNEVIFVQISGEGDYEFTVQYTDDTEEAVEDLVQAIGLLTTIMICLPLIIAGGIMLIFVAIIVIVVVALVKGTKKNK